MNFNNDVGIEHDKNFEDDNELKSLLKQYLLMKIYMKII